MTFFVRPIIRPPANLYKNDGGGGGGEGGGQNSCIPKWPPILMLQIFWPFLGIQFLAPSPLPPPQQWLQRIYMYDTTKHPHVGFIKILFPWAMSKGPQAT